MMTAPAVATLVLRVDAAANALLAAGVLALLGPLTEAAGLPGVWPLVVLAPVLVMNAALCWRAARGGRPAPRALRGLAAVDAVFTVAVLSFALADVTAAVLWLRAMLVVLAIVVALVAAAKLLLARRLAAAPAPAGSRAVAHSRPARRA